jgi:ABC-type transporter Mla MlaB component
MPRDGTELALGCGMTVRITVAEPTLLRRIVVEGRLSADAVRDLEQAVGDQPQDVVLDLANLRSADGAGVAVLRRLRAEGVAMQRTGLHLAWRIDEEPRDGEEEQTR